MCRESPIFKKGDILDSLMETFIYNILSNNLLYLISNLCEIYNYVDDNSICVHAKNVNDMVSKIESYLQGNKPLLYVHTIKLIPVEVCMIVNMLGLKYLHEMFVVHDSAYNMRNSMNIVMPKFNNIKYGSNSISYTGAKLWNILNNYTKLAINIKAFSRFIMLWNVPVCSCFNCTDCSLKCM